MNRILTLLCVLFLFNVTIIIAQSHDVAVELTQPVAGFNCDSGMVEIEILNYGTATQSNFSVNYQIGTSTVVTETFAGSIIGGQTSLYAFTTLPSFTVGNQTITAWATIPLDTITSNDTASLLYNYVMPVTVVPTFTEDFETQAVCTPIGVCNTVACPLVGGWQNLTNGQDDDVDWRVNSGNTISIGTGPSMDHNPGTTTGNYLYLESSAGTCYLGEGHLISPCIDLTGGGVAEASFWYHLYGATMGELHVDIADGTTWINDVVPPIVGDQGNTWHQLTVNLGAYSGNVIKMRIRGILGSSFTSDMAIDDFSINYLVVPPVSNFTADNIAPCQGSIVHLEDHSSNMPTSWNWTITPNTFSFVNGTSANEQNPQIRFNTNGIYDIKLVVGNANGIDSTTRTNYINVSEGVMTPFTENFELNTFPPQAWSVDNTDISNTWESTFVVGSDGQATNAAYIDNFNYNASGAKDFLTTLSIDLTTASAAQLVFDVAYAQLNTQHTDSLRIDISTDCGATFTEGVYLKGGADLSTIGTMNTFFTPFSATDWRNEVIDLTNFVGGSLVIRFVNINDNGNALYIDNVDVLEIALPTANFNVNGTACVAGVDYQDNSLNVDSYQWDFGADATPASATTAGPHTIVYSANGMKTVQLIVSNGVGNDTITQQIDVLAIPTANFTFVDGLPNGGVNFSNTSTSASTYYWTFGDGNTSTLPNPSHSYGNAGNYTVTLEVSNDCGTDTDTMMVMATNTLGIVNPLKVNVFPNPNDGKFNVVIDGISNDLELKVFDIQGKTVQTEHFGKVGSSFQTNIDLSNIAEGVYILRIQTEEFVRNVKIVKHHNH